ncbi:MAG: GNAT family N-acyltransferase [Pseudoalteromonas distincta]|tara:strand:- start:15337 stop:16089 length:753 start_codon:yes stop_codon:yes gene_type:complete
MSHAALAIETTQERHLSVELVQDRHSLRAAQALRFQVFSEECGAHLANSESGLDQDLFDLHCEHLIVRDRHTGAVVATTRLLDSQRARQAGGFYSESEFQLVGLSQLRGDILEIGRTCVHADYRNGATISVLWSGIAQLMNERHYSYLMGCASVGMGDGGVQAHAVMQRLRERYLCRDWLNAIPRLPIPPMDLPDNVTAQLPPLLKAYMRLGAKICGEPCWDPEFNVADVFILLRREQLCSRYARHFKTA